MRVLINNTVKTDTSDYSFNTREEAEAFYMTLKLGGDKEQPSQPAAAPAPGKPRKGRGGKHAAHH